MDFMPAMEGWLFCLAMATDFEGSDFIDTVALIQQPAAEHVRTPVARPNRRDICRTAFIPLPCILPFSPPSIHGHNQHPPPAEQLDHQRTQAGPMDRKQATRHMIMPILQT